MTTIHVHGDFGVFELSACNAVLNSALNDREFILRMGYISRTPKYNQLAEAGAWTPIDEALMLNVTMLGAGHGHVDIGAGEGAVHCVTRGAAAVAVPGRITRLQLRV